MNAQRRHGSWGEKMDQLGGTIWHFSQKREKGLNVIPSFSLTFFFFYAFLFFSSLFFFSLSFLLVVLSFISSVSSMLAGEICTWWCFFFLWLFSHFVSSHFSFPVKLVPPLRCLFCATSVGHFHATAVVVVPMAVSRRDAMHQWCREGMPPSVVASLIAAPFWGLGHLGLFQPWCLNAGWSGHPNPIPTQP